MRSIRRRLLVTLGVLALAVGTMVPLSAQSKAPADPQIAKVRVAIEQYVERDTKLKGGFFLRDAKEQIVRDLKLDFVHEGIEKGAGGQQVMCVDFLDRNQTRLDVDFSVKPAPSGELQVTDIKIHKVNGVIRK